MPRDNEHGLRNVDLKQTSSASNPLLIAPRIVNTQLVWGNEQMQIEAEAISS